MAASDSSLVSKQRDRNSGDMVMMTAYIKICTFCKKEFGANGALGRRATGSYNSGVDSQPKVFNGYVCDIHQDSIDWNKLTFKVARQHNA